MPIPELDAEGFLPPGMHECTLDEIRERFGLFQRTNQRCELFAHLSQYVESARDSAIVAELVVDGSFTTGKDVPGDIDLVVVLAADHDWASDLRPHQYNAVSKRRIKKRHPFDVFVAPRGSAALTEYVEFFCQVKERPDRRKGVLLVRP